MPTSLYLDTARLGRMSPRAQQTHLDFVRLAAEEPSSLYFEDFLQHGFAAWPDRYKRQFPALTNWLGVSGLKKQLSHVAGRRAPRQVLIAGRSAELMGLGARLLSKACRKVLTTDFSWPTYESVLRHTLTRSTTRLHVARLRTSVLCERMTVDQLVNSLANTFVENDCDGLFLPAVDNLGIRLPVGDIVRSIRRQAELRFVVIDAAQAFAHVPLDDCLSVSDFTLASCHKWLQAYFPLAVAFYDQPATRDLVDRTAARMLHNHEIDDALLRFCRQVTSARLDGYSETVNVGPLFSCCGAAAHAPRTSLSPNNSLLQQSANAKSVADIASETDWHPVMPHEGLRSGILLLERRSHSAEHSTADELRRLFQQHGVIVTAYDGGFVRLSMPKHPFSQSELQQLYHVLQAPDRNVQVRARVAVNQPKWAAEYTMSL